MRILAALLLVGLLAGCAQAPVHETLPPAASLIRTSPLPAEQVYRFVSGDEFDLRVPDAPQLDQTVRVRPDGHVSFPLIGTLRVEGRTVEDVQAELRTRLDVLGGEELQRDYLLHPNDEIEVKFPFAPALNELAKIRPDGKIQLQMVGSVKAEGLSPEELRRDLVRRYTRWLRTPDVAVIVRSVNSQSVRTAQGGGRAGLRGLKPVLIVRSFQPLQIFVGGEVARPGTMAFRPGISLFQALIEAGGQLPTGDPSRLTILRRASDDSVEVVQTNFDADLLRSPNRDILLRPFDVVMLPKSGAATLADNLNKYVFNLVPFLRNSSIGATYSRGSQTQ